MYMPRTTRTSDPAHARAIVDDAPFATLISAGPPLHITHVPLYCPEPAPALTRVLGHMARANPHAGVLDGAPVTAVFHGPHAYISPRWYASDDQVPTWNYLAVHVHGTARAITDPAEAEAQLLDQIARLEGDAWRPNPDVLRAKLPGVVLFEIRVDRVEAKAKLSQDKATADRVGARRGLEAGGRDLDRDVARWMVRTGTPGEDG